MGFVAAGTSAAISYFPDTHAVQGRLCQSGAAN
jgi:hypothetical protein